MTQLLENIFAVEVPDDAKDFVIDMGYLIFKVMDMNPKKWVTDKQIEQDVRRFLKTGKSRFDNVKEESMWQTTGMPIPKGSYEILFTTKDCTEEHVMGLVAVKEANGYPIGFKDYGSEDNSISFREAKESLQSLLRSYGLSTDKNYLLLKRIDL